MTHACRRGLFALAGLVLASGSGFSCLRQLTVMPGRTLEGPSPPLSAREAALAPSLERDVTHLAGTIGERNLGRTPDKLVETAEWVEAELVAAGYTVEREPYDVRGQRVWNLAAELEGTTDPDELIVIGAHYDSAEGTRGADDNASGVAVALSLARTFRARPQPRTLRFVFFTNEEPPYFRTPDMGSEVAAKRARQRGDDVRAMLSLETLGYYSDAPGSQHYPWPFSTFYPSTGHFIGFVADLTSKALAHEAVRTFREHASIASEGATVPSFIEGIDWSDHGPYWRQGYQALMVTDTAPFRNPSYHSSTDLPSSLDYARMARVTVGLEAVVQRLAQSP
ncbi:MAG: M20/M25/M40 family metallo-hydrolase [Myxococcaceae bacterium]|nr:M20/M25/M40 family metallo-hydrolase [Myxococcaceae bacterium]